MCSPSHLYPLTLSLWLWSGSNLQALSFLGLLLTFLNAVSALRMLWNRRCKNSKPRLPYSSTGTGEGGWRTIWQRVALGLEKEMTSD